MKKKKNHFVNSWNASVNANMRNSEYECDQNLTFFSVNDNTIRQKSSQTHDYLQNKSS